MPNCSSVGANAFGPAIESNGDIPVFEFNNALMFTISERFNLNNFAVGSPRVSDVSFFPRMNDDVVAPDENVGGCRA